LFNNRIYGLTKGQYSPTSEVGKVTKSTPVGSVDSPLNPVSLALGAEATFVARTLDSDRKHLTDVLRAAAAHRGSALVEIYQNCPIFNDGAFDALKGAPRSGGGPGDGSAAVIPLVHGEPIRFGAGGSKGVIKTGASRLEVVDVAPSNEADILVHDAQDPDPTTAFALSRLTDSGDLHQAPVGIFRAVEKPTYDDQARAQVARASEQSTAGDDALTALLEGGETWTVA